MTVTDNTAKPGLTLGPVRIYVAASSREMPRVDRVNAMIEALGPEVVITFRWIDSMRAAMAAGKKESDLTKEEAQKVGRECLAGVWTADATLLLYPNEPTRGAWGEIAVAITMREMGGGGNTHLSVVAFEGPSQFRQNDPGHGSQIFSRMADAEIAGDKNALVWLCEKLAPHVDAAKRLEAF